MNEKIARIVEALQDELVNQVRENLTPDLLKPGYGNPDNPMAGHCYAASEALYHLLGGQESGWKPMRMRMDDGDVHWWLANSDGDVLDPTHDQFDHPVPYSEGRAGGFLTAQPSKRAADLINRVTGIKTTKLTGYEQQREAGTQPVEVMSDNPGGILYWANGGGDKDLARARVAWAYQGGTLYVGQNHRDIIRAFKDEGFSFNDEDGIDKTLFGWIDPVGDGKPYEIVTDFGTQDANLLPEVQAFFEKYPPQSVLNYVRTGQLTTPPELEYLNHIDKPESAGQWMHQSKIADDFSAPQENPVSYQFVPLTQYELEQFNSLDPRQKVWWSRKANKLNVYAKNRGTVQGQQLYALANRYQGNCAYCGHPGATSWDHVVPLGKGGQNTIDNLLPCHVACNHEMNEWDNTIEKGRPPIAASVRLSMNYEFVDGGGHVWLEERMPWVYNIANDTLYYSDWGAFHRPILRYLKLNAEHGSEVLPEEDQLLAGYTLSNGHWEFSHPEMHEYLSDDVEAELTHFSESEAQHHNEFLEETGQADSQEYDMFGVPITQPSKTATVEWVETRPGNQHGSGLPFMYVPDHDTLYLGTTSDYHSRLIKNNTDLFSFVHPEEYMNGVGFVPGRVDIKGNLYLYDHTVSPEAMEIYEPKIMDELRSEWPEIESRLKDDADSYSYDISDEDADANLFRSLSKIALDLAMPPDVSGNPDYAQEFFAFIYSPSKDVLFGRWGGLHRDLAKLFQRNFGDAADAQFGWLRDGNVYLHGLDLASPELIQRVIALSEKGKTSKLAVELPHVTWVETGEGKHGLGLPFIYISEQDHLYVGTTQAFHRALIGNDEQLQESIRPQDYPYNAPSIVTGRIDWHGHVGFYDISDQDEDKLSRTMELLSEAWPYMEGRDALRKNPDDGIFDDSLGGLDFDSPIRKVQPTSAWKLAMPMDLPAGITFDVEQNETGWAEGMWKVTANADGREIGHLWLEHDGRGVYTISHIWTDSRYQRRGIATSMLKAAEDKGFHITHDWLNMTQEGYDWATKGLGDNAPEWTIVSVLQAYRYIIDKDGNEYNDADDGDIVRHRDLAKKYNLSWKDVADVGVYDPSSPGGRKSLKDLPGRAKEFYQFDFDRDDDTPAIPYNDFTGKTADFIDNHMGDWAWFTSWLYLSNGMLLATTEPQTNHAMLLRQHGMKPSMIREHNIQLIPGLIVYDPWNGSDNPDAIMPLYSDEFRHDNVIDPGLMKKAIDAIRQFCQEHWGNLPVVKPTTEFGEGSDDSIPTSDLIQQGKTSNAVLVETPNDGYGGTNQGTIHTTIYDPATDTLYVNSVPGASHRSLLRSLKNDLHEEDSDWRGSGVGYGYINPWSATYHQYDMTDVRAPESAFADGVRTLRAENPAFWDAVDRRLESKIAESTSQPLPEPYASQPWHQEDWLNMRSDYHGMYGDDQDVHFMSMPLVVTPEGRYWVGDPGQSHQYHSEEAYALRQLGYDPRDYSQDYSHMTQGGVNVVGNEYSVHLPDNHNLTPEAIADIHRRAIDKADELRKTDYDRAMRKRDEDEVEYNHRTHDMAKWWENKTSKVERLDYPVTGFGGRGGDERWPVVYDPHTDTAYIGPLDASHASVIKNMKNRWAPMMNDTGMGYEHEQPELSELSYAAVDYDGGYYYWVYYAGDIPEHIEQEVNEALDVKAHTEYKNSGWKIGMGLRGDLPQGIEFKIDDALNGDDLEDKGYNMQQGFEPSLYTQHFITAWLNGKQIAGMTVNEDGTIGGIDVEPEYQRMGVATALLAHAQSAGIYVDHDWGNLSQDAWNWVQKIEPDKAKDWADNYADYEHMTVDPYRQEWERQRGLTAKTADYRGSWIYQNGNIYMGDTAVGDLHRHIMRDNGVDASQPFVAGTYQDDPEGKLYATIFSGEFNKDIDRDLVPTALQALAEYLHAPVTSVAYGEWGDTYTPKTAALIPNDPTRNATWKWAYNPQTDEFKAWDVDEDQMPEHSQMVDDFSAWITGRGDAHNVWVNRNGDMPGNKQAVQHAEDWLLNSSRENTAALLDETFWHVAPKRMRNKIKANGMPVGTYLFTNESQAEEWWDDTENGNGEPSDIWQIAGPIDVEDNENWYGTYITNTPISPASLTLLDVEHLRQTGTAERQARLAEWFDTQAIPPMNTHPNLSSRYAQVSTQFSTPTQLAQSDRNVKRMNTGISTSSVQSQGSSGSLTPMYRTQPHASTRVDPHQTGPPRVPPVDSGTLISGSHKFSSFSGIQSDNEQLELFPNSPSERDGLTPNVFNGWTVKYVPTKSIPSYVEDWDNKRRPVLGDEMNKLLYVGNPGHHHRPLWSAVKGDPDWTDREYDSMPELYGWMVPGLKPYISGDHDDAEQALIQAENAGQLGHNTAKRASEDVPENEDVSEPDQMFHIQMVDTRKTDPNHVAWVYDVESHILYIAEEAHHRQLLNKLPVGLVTQQNVEDGEVILGDVERGDITWSAEIDEAVLDYLGRRYDASHTSKVATDYYKGDWQVQTLPTDAEDNDTDPWDDARRPILWGNGTIYVGSPGDHHRALMKAIRRLGLDPRDYPYWGFTRPNGFTYINPGQYGWEQVQETMDKWMGQHASRTASLQTVVVPIYHRPYTDSLHAWLYDWNSNILYMGVLGSGHNDILKYMKANGLYEKNDDQDSGDLERHPDGQYSAGSYAEPTMQADVYGGRQVGLDFLQQVEQEGQYYFSKMGSMRTADGQAQVDEVIQMNSETDKDHDALLYVPVLKTLYIAWNGHHRDIRKAYPEAAKAGFFLWADVEFGQLSVWNTSMGSEPSDSYTEPLDAAFVQARNSKTALFDTQVVPTDCGYGAPTPQDHTYIWLTRRGSNKVYIGPGVAFHRGLAKANNIPSPLLSDGGYWSKDRCVDRNGGSAPDVDQAIRQWRSDAGVSSEPTTMYAKTATNVMQVPVKRLDAGHDAWVWDHSNDTIYYAKGGHHRELVNWLRGLNFELMHAAKDDPDRFSVGDVESTLGPEGNVYFVVSDFAELIPEFKPLSLEDQWQIKDVAAQVREPTSALGRVSSLENVSVVPDDGARTLGHDAVIYDPETNHMWICPDGHHRAIFKAFPGMKKILYRCGIYEVNYNAPHSFGMFPDAIGMPGATYDNLGVADALYMKWKQQDDTRNAKVSAFDVTEVTPDNVTYGHDAVVYDPLNDHLYICPDGHHRAIFREFASTLKGRYDELGLYEGNYESPYFGGLKVDQNPINEENALAMKNRADELYFNWLEEERPHLTAKTAAGEVKVIMPTNSFDPAHTAVIYDATDDNLYVCPGGHHRKIIRENPKLILHNIFYYEESSPGGWQIVYDDAGVQSFEPRAKELFEQWAESHYAKTAYELPDVEELPYGYPTAIEPDGTAHVLPDERSYHPELFRHLKAEGYKGSELKTWAWGYYLKDESGWYFNEGSDSFGYKSAPEITRIVEADAPPLDEIHVPTAGMHPYGDMPFVYYRDQNMLFYTTQSGRHRDIFMFIKREYPELLSTDLVNAGNLCMGEYVPDSDAEYMGDLDFFNTFGSRMPHEEVMRSFPEMYRWAIDHFPDAKESRVSSETFAPGSGNDADGWAYLPGGNVVRGYNHRKIVQYLKDEKIDPYNAVYGWRSDAFGKDRFWIISYNHDIYQNRQLEDEARQYFVDQGYTEVDPMKFGTALPTVKYVPEGGAKIDSSRTPVVYDPAVNTVYIGDRGGTHPWLFEQAAGVHMHMSEVPLKRKDLYHTMSAGLYSPEDEAVPYGIAVPGEMEWFHGPLAMLDSDSGAVDAAIKRYTEKEYVDPRPAKQQLEDWTQDHLGAEADRQLQMDVGEPCKEVAVKSTGAHGEGDIPFIYYYPTNTVYYLPDSGFHNDLFTYIKDQGLIENFRDMSGQMILGEGWKEYFETGKPRYKIYEKPLDEPIPAGFQAWLDREFPNGSAAHDKYVLTESTYDRMNERWDEHYDASPFVWVKGKTWIGRGTEFDPEPTHGDLKRQDPKFYREFMNAFKDSEDAGFMGYHEDSPVYVGRIFPDGECVEWSDKPIPEDVQQQVRYKYNTDKDAPEPTTLEPQGDQMSLFSSTTKVDVLSVEDLGAQIPFERGNAFLYDPKIDTVYLGPNGFQHGALMYGLQYSRGLDRKDISDFWPGAINEYHFGDPDGFWFNDMSADYGWTPQLKAKIKMALQPYAKAEEDYTPPDALLEFNGDMPFTAAGDDSPDPYDKIPQKEHLMAFIYDAKTDQLTTSIDLGCPYFHPKMIKVMGIRDEVRERPDDFAFGWAEQGPSGKWYYDLVSVEEKNSETYATRTGAIDAFIKRFPGAEPRPVGGNFDLPVTAKLADGPIQEVRIPVKKVHSDGDYPFVYLPSLNTCFITEQPGFHRDIQYYFKDHGIPWDWEAIVGEYNATGKPYIDYYNRGSQGVVPDDVHNFINSKLAEQLISQKESAMQPTKVQWIGAPSRSAIWVWHIPTNTLVFANMFQTYHRTIMREMEPNAKIRESDKLFLTGELDYVGDQVEVSDRQGFDYPNNDVSEAVKNAYLSSGGANLPPGAPGLSLNSSYYEFVAESDAESRWGGLPFVITPEGKVIVGDDPEEHHRQMMKSIGLSKHDIEVAGVIYPDHTFTFLWGEGDVDEISDALSEIPDSVWDGYGYNLHEAAPQITLQHVPAVTPPDGNYGRQIPLLFDQRTGTLYYGDVNGMHKDLIRAVGLGHEDGFDVANDPEVKHSLMAGLASGPGHVIWYGDPGAVVTEFANQMSYNWYGHQAGIDSPPIQDWTGSWFYFPDSDEFFTADPSLHENWEDKTDHSDLIRMHDLRPRVKTEPFVAGWYLPPDGGQGWKIAPWGSDQLGQNDYSQEGNAMPRILEKAREQMPHNQFQY